jgi:hypothetical protein
LGELPSYYFLILMGQSNWLIATPKKNKKIIELGRYLI